MGVLEIEGNVFITITENKRYSSGFQVEIGYAVSSKSKEALTLISDLLTENEIGHKIVQNKIEVCKLEHFRQLIMFVETHKFRNSQRKRQLVVIKRAFMLFENKEHLTEKGLKKLRKLKEELHELKHELNVSKSEY
jgi:hypothetical protein